MRNLFLYTFAISILSVYLPVYSQQMLGMSYNMGLPQGEMKSQIDNNSYLGFGIEGRQFIHADISYGISFNWNKFQSGNIRPALPGTPAEIEERKIDSFPLLLNIHYYLSAEHHSYRPCFGLNAGTYFINNRVITPVGLRQQKNWHFGFAPELGVIIRLVSDLHLLIMGRYNYALGSGGSYDYEYLGIHLTFVSISIL